MTLDLILACHGRSKISMMLTNDADDLFAKRIAMPPVAWSAALA
ncbi:hypothetical protein L284_09500 [Novosphingobium lindaniclasticum LE124]|uniref:Uncharacterized protein n=1 Tax=Novosphingobium lindaniclasticum LE124 TaxID=1096930 RepID=T0HJ61_9SPHN|nr:hypothetical protein L284_09500 [Novosphingobium lindaniclasticum LE124]